MVQTFKFKDMENIKKSVISGEFIIEIDKTGHVSVYRIYDNVMGSIREIYEKENLEYDPTWTQRQIGYNLIKKYCTEEDKTQAIIGEYLIHKRENGSIETFREYGKGNVIGALREVAKTVGFEVDPNWTTQQLGNKLVDFIKDKPQNTYVMNELKLNGRMTVASMKELFKTLTGGTLRVKDGGRKADESATLASIRKDSDDKNGVMELSPEMTVGDFKAKMLSDFGLKVEVGTPDDWVSVPDGITLGQLRELPKNAVKAQLEALVVGGKEQVNIDTPVVRINFETAGNKEEMYDGWWGGEGIFLVSSNLSDNNAPIQEIYWSGIVTCAFRALDEIAYSGVVEDLEEMHEEWNHEYEESGENQRYNILYLCAGLPEDCCLSYEQVLKALEIRYCTEDSNVDEDYESGEVIFVVSVDDNSPLRIQHIG